eukprot:scaffold11111_cov151-Skeletonema_dohrnii-CCMP3373.AAC.1
MSIDNGVISVDAGTLLRNGVTAMSSIRRHRANISSSVITWARSIIPSACVCEIFSERAAVHERKDCELNARKVLGRR